MPLRGCGHVSKVSACLVSTNSPLTKLLGPQWRVKWFGNKERLALPLFLPLPLVPAHTNRGERTHTRTPTIVHKAEEGEMICLVFDHRLQSVFYELSGFYEAVLVSQILRNVAPNAQLEVVVASVRVSIRTAQAPFLVPA